MHKKNSKSDIRVFEMANYVRPPVVESLTYDWVLNGRYNSFYDDLVDYYNGSVTHATIINSYTDLIYGRGLTLNHSEEQLVNWIKFRQALSKKTLKKIIADYVLYEASAILITKTKTGHTDNGIFR